MSEIIFKGIENHRGRFHNRGIRTGARFLAMNIPLTAYRIFLSDGSDYVTNMSPTTTLEAARHYFMGKVFVSEDQRTGKEVSRKVIAVIPTSTSI